MYGQTRGLITNITNFYDLTSFRIFLYHYELYIYLGGNIVHLCMYVGRHARNTNFDATQQNRNNELEFYFSLFEIIRPCVKLLRFLISKDLINYNNITNYNLIRLVNLLLGILSILGSHFVT
jgi:hypothetical protein